MDDLEEMKLKPMTGKVYKKFWYTVLILFLSWLLLFYFHYSDINNDHNLETSLKNNFLHTHESNSLPEDEISIENHIENEAKSIHRVFDSGNVQESSNNLDSALSTLSPEKEKEKDEQQSCSGRYIYMHDLPSKFNEDLVKHCELLSEWTDLCPFVSNSGFGPKIRDPVVLSETGWFDTNQFMLELIFHARMKEYKCLTNDSSTASAIFVPYYPGLDVVRYLWSSNRTRMKDQNPDSLVRLLREKPEWKKLWGRDHFMVAGRICWDFRRPKDNTSAWGNSLMVLPESKNMTFLTIESSPWNGNDYAIPYPSYFHPSFSDEIYNWQNRMRTIKRQYLFSFAGAPRPDKDTDIRGEIIKQCQATKRRCNLLKECKAKERQCHNPVSVMKTFQNSVFCLQPPGDSYTRRSTFDSMLAGCIPVFFHPGSAYVQYLWHLPGDYTKYSVFIPVSKVKKGERSIERILTKIPRRKRLAMKEEVLKLIPRIVYVNPSSSLETLEDAFDITIDRVLERVEKIREDIRNGKNLTLDDQEEFTWKKNLFGTVREHEWDSFFIRA